VKLQLHFQARQELEAAAAWYENERPGLGDEFIEELSDAFSTIETSPKTWPVVRPSGLRRFLLSRFPYSIVYAVGDEYIRVYAVAHQKRRPGYWLGREFE
jgi:plasmid stabilization system protein ParE